MLDVDYQTTYDNVLNIVAIENNRSSIASAIMKTIGVDSSGSDDYGYSGFYTKVAYKYASDTVAESDATE